ncbi:MAG: M20 family metallopeptidase [Planctomycetota bacterium]
MASAVLDQALTDRVVGWRHDLHAHPELMYEERYASGLVQRELGRIGVPFEAGLAETGVIGWIVGKRHGEAERSRGIGLRADMDALPILEATGLAYTSVNEGVMHACGHDGHTAALLGAAEVLWGMREELPRPVKLVFQPAEEGGAGAKRLIEAGALDAEVGGVRVTEMYGLHGWPESEVGTWASRAGALLAATDEVRVVVRGKGGHAAVPHLSNDPVPAAAALVLAAQSLVSRRVPSADQAVLSITQLRAGVGDGSATNVIPDTAELAGTLRTLTPAVREQVVAELRAMAEGVAAAHGCSAEFVHEPGYPVTMNDAGATAYATACAERVLGGVGEGCVLEVPEPIMGGEDFSYYSGVMPTNFGFVGLRPAGQESYAGLHTPGFDFNDDALPVAVGLLVEFARVGGLSEG